jgi:hypothetical protein
MSGRHCIVGVRCRARGDCIVHITVEQRENANGEDLPTRTI